MNAISCQIMSNKVGQNPDFSKKLIFSLVPIFTIWLLHAKCAVLCGKPPDRMKIHKIFVNFCYCTMLGVNWKYQFFSKEGFFESKNMTKIGKFYADLTEKMSKILTVWTVN